MWLAGEKVFNIADQGNANQNCDEISLHNRMVLSKRTRDNKCWQGCREKGSPHALLVGMKTDTATMENHIEGPLKTKNKVTI